MKNVFDVNDLKTGMHVTLTNGRSYTVLLDAVHEYNEATDFLVNSEEGSASWLPIKGYVNACGWSGYQIRKVALPYHIYDVFYKHQGYKTIWEYQEETEQQKQIRELEETINQSS